MRFSFLRRVLLRSTGRERGWRVGQVARRCEAEHACGSSSRPPLHLVTAWSERALDARSHTCGGCALHVLAPSAQTKTVILLLRMTLLVGVVVFRTACQDVLAPSAHEKTALELRLVLLLMLLLMRVLVVVIVVVVVPRTARWHSSQRR
jgi:hypothetical protein